MQNLRVIDQNLDDIASIKTQPKKSWPKDLVVLKFGGATLATPQHIQKAALRVANVAKNNLVVVVVSAMGSQTNQFLKLAREVSSAPNPRELDMLVSTGERISMSLLSMALNDLGCSAVSFTGSQAGILTDDDHFSAHILDIKPFRVEEALQKNRVVILAGYQGVSLKTKEITTLGRGGSDVTAVGIAAALGASRCEILKEVDGVYTHDPKKFPAAKLIKNITFAPFCEMTFWGAQVVQYRAARLAEKFSMHLVVAPADKPEQTGTQISAKADNEEFFNQHQNIIKLKLNNSDEKAFQKILKQEFESRNLLPLQILAHDEDENSYYLTGTQDLVIGAKLGFHLSPSNALKIQENLLTSETITCSQVLDENLKEIYLKKLCETDPPSAVVTTKYSVTVFRS